jgi:hypothetical protein
LPEWSSSYLVINGKNKETPNPKTRTDTNAGKDGIPLRNTPKKKIPAIIVITATMVLETDFTSCLARQFSQTTGLYENNTDLYTWLHLNLSSHFLHFCSKSNSSWLFISKTSISGGFVHPPLMDN